MLDFDWSTPNWTVLVGLVSAIFGAASRGLVGWWSSRNKAKEIVETAAARVDRVAREQSDFAAAEQVRLAEALAKLNNEHDDLWEQARGMDTWAHFFRHYCLNVLQRYQIVLSILDQLASNSISPGRAAGFAARLQANTPREPPPVPLLHEATKPPPNMFDQPERE